MMYVGGHPSLPIEAFQQRLSAVDTNLKQNVARCRKSSVIATESVPGVERNAFPKRDGVQTGGRPGGYLPSFFKYSSVWFGKLRM